MALSEILAELESLGSASYRNTMMNHGAREPIFGVKIEYLKKIHKRVKKDYRLALNLYDSGVYDAMYLAGLVADEEKMTRKDLQRWMAGAYCGGLSEYTVPWVTSESRYGHEFAVKWIDSTKERVAAAGWATLNSLVLLKEDDALDVPELRQFLQRVAKTIHDAPNRVRYTMNNFIIAAGSGVAALTKLALATAKEIGPVSVDMGDTCCKVPTAAEYIKKVQLRGAIGKKRKSARC